ncbi:hypothetical protein [Streptomyces sp. CFMR 7]|uniref:hypothetical protein n=1 Tax=Streptomyces sp. CFMR 7 TaxID=1649184 RepID=UPI0006AD5113|nr:hypothetical protein [Streptomyces sp. CFMR 7]ALC30496.1 hypothetical protein ABE83_28190 [Streptomyces sp. CFMR 7]
MTCALCSAPVHTQFATPELVLVTGQTADGSGLHFHNPSGTDAGTRAAVLPVAEFERFFAGRGVSLA